MKLVQRPLSLIVLLLVLLVCGIAIARSRTTLSPQKVGSCTDNCAERRDKTLERCDSMPEERRAPCREQANEQYNKCVERCGDRAH